MTWIIFFKGHTFSYFISLQKGEIVGKLLGVDGIDLYTCLCKPKIKVGSEFVTQGRNVEQVLYSVGALSKALFDRMFKWLVKKCNITLETGLKRHSFIGVLDIAGFEIFDVGCGVTNNSQQCFIRLLTFFVYTIIISQSYNAYEGILLSHSSTASSRSASTSVMRSCNSSSTITCSCWNKKSTSEKASTGLSWISVWTCKLALSSSKR